MKNIFAAGSIYLDLAVVLGVLVVVITLTGLFRTGINRVPGARKKGRWILLSRAAFPLIFIGVVAAARVLFPVSTKLESYFGAAVLFFIIVFIIRMIDGSILAWYSGRQKSYPLPDVLHGLIIGVIYLAVFFSILKTALQMDISKLLTGSAILTAIIGLALQGVLSNILAGMSLHFTHAFKQGDWIGLGGFEGVVMDMNWRETRILDRASNMVVLPNNVVAGERIVNYSRPDRRTAILMTLNVSAVAPAAEVTAVLLEAARECSYVIREPKPKAYLTSFDETGVSYRLKIWVEDFALKFTILTEVGRLIWYKMRRRGIEVAVSWTDRFGEMREMIAASGEAGERGERPGAKDEAGGGPVEAGAMTGAGRRARETSVERTAGILLGSSFLRFQEGDKAGELMVAEADIRSMAARIIRSAYTKGEVLFRQGDPGASCFVVARGRIKGEIVYEENGKRFSREFEIGPGGLFGEMSLFTGLPRTATGVVVEESELLEIQAEDFRRLLVRNPETAEAIADIVSARNAQNKEFLLKIKELSAQQVEDSASRHSVLAYLKRFIHGLLT